MRYARAMALVLGMAPSVVLAAPAPTSAAPTAIPAQVLLRDSGYVLGDVIEQRVRFELAADTRLKRESLPSLGPVQHWLELRELHWHDHGELVLRYQIFAAVEHSLRLALPALTLRFAAAQGEVVATVAEQPFYLSPVLPPNLDTDSQTPRASPPPQLPHSAAARRLGLWAVLALLLALALAWHADRLPWLWRWPGPLTRLHRRLRRASVAASNLESYRQQLAEVHQAFAACAGQTLYRDNLDRLFAAAPYLRPLQTEIAAFFEHAHQYLYWRDAPPPWPQPRLVALCRSAMLQERSLGRPRPMATARGS
ncbi:hypothetical protein [Panacagrimonas sp.]|uniref:hypothetical protein n=1 Tax=Panacagrimonas sp. TaxID=2480088 RepID=UPI003B51B1F0